MVWGSLVSVVYELAYLSILLCLCLIWCLMLFAFGWVFRCCIIELSFSFSFSSYSLKENATLTCVEFCGRWCGGGHRHARTAIVLGNRIHVSVRLITTSLSYTHMSWDEHKASKNVHHIPKENSFTFDVCIVQCASAYRSLYNIKVYRS